jgi:HEAT repeat protein
MEAFDELLERLRDDEDIPSGEWDPLSALVDERYTAFKALWESLGASRRLALLDSLHDEAEENAHLDFTPIWHLALVDDASKVRLAGIAYSADEEGDWLIDPLLRLAAIDQEASVRAAAADALGRFAYLAEVGDLPEGRAAQIQRALLALVNRPEEPMAVRNAALASVGYFSTAPVTAAIREFHADPDLRQSAIRAMGRQCDPEWTETLLDETSRGTAALREEAARAIGEIEDSRGVSRLLELLEDPAVAVRLAAIWALGEIGGEEAQEALIFCLEDSNDVVREAAEAALTELAGRDSVL